MAIPGLSRAPQLRLVTTYQTEDGGKTWKEGVPVTLPARYPPAAPLAPGLQFVDAKHGWLTLGFEGADRGSTGVGIYRTTDGGMNWKEVSLTIRSPGQSSPSSLPTGCGKTGITFSDPLRGWATAHCADGSLFFYASGDGGLTWHPQNLPPPAGYPSDLFGNCDCGSLPPIFTSSRDGVLMLHNPDLLYITNDGGDSWSPTQLPQKYVSNFYFLDARRGWLVGLAPDAQTHSLHFNQLYFTQDGGHSWQGFTPNHELAGPVGFLTEKLGWSLYLKARIPEVLQTTDGGKTWQPVQPQLVQGTSSAQA
jgi:photosystem II stability/assembly factor-like uncharacterized protein